MARKPKVFVFSDGLHAWTVATSSRAKAVAAWGMERDPFEIGAAREIESGPDYAAALDEPGVVIRRGLAVDVGKVSRQPKPAKAKAPSRAALDRVRKLEADLEALDGEQAEKRDDLARRRAALDKEQAAQDRAHAKARDALAARLKSARAKLKS